MMREDPYNYIYSRMDEVMKFKGTGNSEIILD